jgi:hypothetical protein
VLQLSVIPRTLARNLLHTLTILASDYKLKLSHYTPRRRLGGEEVQILLASDINVKTSSLENGDESKEKLFIFSAPNNLPNNLLKYCTRALNHYIINKYILYTPEHIPSV